LRSVRYNNKDDDDEMLFTVHTVCNRRSCWQ